MVDRQGDSHTHIDDAVQELKDFHVEDSMDESLRDCDEALAAISSSQNPVSSMPWLLLRSQTKWARAK